MNPNPNRPILDMTPEGDFREPAPRPGSERLNRVLVRVGGVAIVLAVIAGALAVAAVAVVSLAVLIPVTIIAGAIGAVSLWWRLRRARGAAGSQVTRP